LGTRPTHPSGGENIVSLVMPVAVFQIELITVLCRPHGLIFVSRFMCENLCFTRLGTFILIKKIDIVNVKVTDSGD
jgi:hypothetical protein